MEIAHEKLDKNTWSSQQLKGTERIPDKHKRQRLNEFIDIKVNWNQIGNYHYCIFAANPKHLKPSCQIDLETISICPQRLNVLVTFLKQTNKKASKKVSVDIIKCCPTLKRSARTQMLLEHVNNKIPRISNLSAQRMCNFCHFCNICNFRLLRFCKMQLSLSCWDFSEAIRNSRWKNVNWTILNFN